eukprot:3481376-Amphidinium_carterae.1
MSQRLENESIRAKTNKHVIDQGIRTCQEHKSKNNMQEVPRVTNIGFCYIDLETPDPYPSQKQKPYLPRRYKNTFKHVVAVRLRSMVSLRPDVEGRST